MGDFVVIAILLTVVALVVRGMVTSRKRGGCVVAIKDGRYNIDSHLAEAILI